MRPLLAFAALAYLVLLFALPGFSSPLAAVAGAALAYVATAYLAAPPAVGWEAAREVSPERPVAGERVRVRIELRGPRGFSVFARDALPPGIDPATVIGRTDAAGSDSRLSTIEYSFVAERGPLVFSDVVATARGAVFAASRSLRIPCALDLCCAPADPPPVDLAISTRKTLAYSGDIRSRSSGSGDEFFLVREYRAGDPLKRLNWRASARAADLPGASSSELRVNDFERRRNADVGFVLDTRMTPTAIPDRDADIDAFATLELALAADCARKGHRVSHMTFGMPLAWVTPGYGKVQALRIRAALAQAAPSLPSTIDSVSYLPDTVFPHQSTLFLMLKTLGEEEGAVRSLVSKRYRVVVVTSDLERRKIRAARPGRRSMAAEALEDFERAEALLSFRRAGAIVYDMTEAGDIRKTASDLSRLLSSASCAGFAGGRP